MVAVRVKGEGKALEDAEVDNWAKVEEARGP